MMSRLSCLLFILILFGCSGKQVKEAVNGMQDLPNVLLKTEIDLIFEKVKTFPNGTQVSMGLVDGENIHFVDVKRLNDTIRFVENTNKVFEIGSITKVFTATLLAGLVLEGEVALTDNIQDYLNIELNENQRIELKQLANHTSGLPRLPSNLIPLLVGKANPYKKYDEEKLKDYLASKMELQQEPGTTYQYSNLGAGLLGFVLSKMAASSYEDLLQERIFKRYNMNHSTTHKQKIGQDIVKGLTPNGKIASHWDFDALAGAGAVFSSVEDLAQFALAQFDEENKELALTRKPTFLKDENLSIGLGWHISKEDDGELIWHNGGTGGYSSCMALDVEHKKGVILLSNVSAYHKKMNHITQLCFQLARNLKSKSI